MKTKEQIQKLIEEKQKELDQLKQELKAAKSPKEAWEEEHRNILKIEGARLEWETWVIGKENEDLIDDQFNLMRQLQIFAKLRNGDWVADWISDIEKFGISLIKGKAIFTYCDTNIFVYGISFKSMEIAQEALEIFGERIEQFYGK